MGQVGRLGKEIPTEEEVGVLREVLQDDSLPFELREWAARQLSRRGRAGDPEAVDSLIATLESDNPRAVITAAHFLAATGKDAVPHLRPLLEHSDHDVRMTAELLLEELSQPPPSELTE